jgi:hypothetical protein
MEYQRLQNFIRRNEMNKRNLIVLMANIALVLALVLAGCNPATPTPTSSATPGATATPTPLETATPTPPAVAELSYRCLNPFGTFIPVQTYPLAPRINSIVGKTICVNQGEADPVIMPALLKIVKEKYPTTKWTYIESSSFGESTPSADTLAGADAVMRGISW